MDNDKLTRRQGNTDFHFCTAVPPWLSGEVPGYVFLNIFPSEVPATVSGKLQEELLLVVSVSKMPDIAPYIMSISPGHGNYSFRKSILHKKNATLRMQMPRFIGILYLIPIIYFDLSWSAPHSLSVIFLLNFL